MKPSTCPHSYERASAFLKHIPSYDIIGLQEVWSPRYQQIEKYAKSKGLHVVGSGHATVSSMLGLRMFGGGLMIMSKYPIEATRELIFDKGVASDGFVRKGILYAKVRIGSSYVHVFNTHMQASYGYEFAENDPYALIRKKQIQQVSDFIAKIALDDHHPIIAMGDFNVNAIRRADAPDNDSREYLDMIASLSRDGLFSVMDLHKDFNAGSHPVTNTGRGVIGKESKGGQRLDFVFEMRRNTTRADRVLHSFTHASVLPFEVSGEKYTHISDHFASHVTLEQILGKHYEIGEDEADGAEIKARGMTVQLIA